MTSFGCSINLKRVIVLKDTNLNFQSQLTKKLKARDRKTTALLKKKIFNDKLLQSQQ